VTTPTIATSNQTRGQGSNALEPRAIQREARVSKQAIQIAGAMKFSIWMRMSVAGMENPQVQVLGPGPKGHAPERRLFNEGLIL
jgi:hypothetical protein